MPLLRLMFILPIAAVLGLACSRGDDSVAGRTQGAGPPTAQAYSSATVSPAVTQLHAPALPLAADAYTSFTALQLTSGAVCRFAPGATLAIGHARLNFYCDDKSFLFGPFDESGPQLLTARVDPVDLEVWRSCVNKLPEPGTPTWGSAAATSEAANNARCDAMATAKFTIVAVKSVSQTCVGTPLGRKVEC